jgi:hypothetical protein
VGREGTFDGALDHHFLNFAFMANRADLLDRLASGGGDFIRANFGTTKGAPDAGVQMDNLAPCRFQTSAQEPAFFFLGILRYDQQDAGLGHCHGVSLKKS